MALTGNSKWQYARRIGWYDEISRKQLPLLSYWEKGEKNGFDYHLKAVLTMKTRTFRWIFQRRIRQVEANSRKWFQRIGEPYSLVVVYFTVRALYPKKDGGYITQILWELAAEMSSCNLAYRNVVTSSNLLRLQNISVKYVHKKWILGAWEVL